MRSPHPIPAKMEQQLAELVSAWIGKAKTGDESYEKAFKESLKGNARNPQGIVIGFEMPLGNSRKAAPALDPFTGFPREAETPSTRAEKRL